MDAAQGWAIGLASLTCALLVVLTRKWHGRWTGDFENSGVQKHHRGSPPRVGALPIAAGLLVGMHLLTTGAASAADSPSRLLGLILLCSLPTVLLGLADDLTKKIPPRVRLVGAFLAGTLAIIFLDNRVYQFGVPGLDTLVALTPVSVALTLVLVGGFTNAMNIVDGLNGLASGLALLMLAATAWVAAGLGDGLVVQLCLVLGLSIAGFFLINFPRGSMFLGDGGAYLIGFVLVQIWLILLRRNPSVSPWFVVALAFHPTMETAFSMYRRRYHRRLRGRAMSADRLHLHSLIYRRRLLPMARRLLSASPWVPNAGAALLVIAFGAVPILAAMRVPTSTAWAFAVIGFSALMYLAAFRWLVGFGAFGRAEDTRLAPPLPNTN